MIDLSVVIPVRNEAPSLDELHAELSNTLRAWGRSYELVVIDDGSTDESFETLDDDTIRPLHADRPD